MEVLVTKEAFILTPPQKQRAGQATRGHTGPHGATQERTRGSRAGHRRKPVFWFLQEQMGKAGRAGSGLASLNFSRGSRVQGLPLAVSYPAPGGVSRGIWLLGHKT